MAIVFGLAVVLGLATVLGLAIVPGLTSWTGSGSVIALALASPLGTIPAANVPGFGAPDSEGANAALGATGSSTIVCGLGSATGATSV